MENDEQEIRQLVSTWMAATKSGDVEKVLSLMADDAVFLVHGRPPMGKADFAAAARTQSGADGPKFDGSSEIRELKVLGDWAFIWQELTVVATPPDGAPPIRRAGHTLTIFRKQNGNWVLARDANMLAVVAK
ncbi:MAG TPA: SgcJ/EcaC family oxidoreductase [Woeseiaceae bacterium]|nr:SgcJ/EcaC family oxidoreductase [Woeseiaceae bacterium]